jgi:hypothetical protein
MVIDSLTENLKMKYNDFFVAMLQMYVFEDGNAPEELQIELIEFQYNSISFQPGSLN